MGGSITMRGEDGERGWSGGRGWEAGKEAKQTKTRCQASTDQVKKKEELSRRVFFFAATGPSRQRIMIENTKSQGVPAL